MRKKKEFKDANRSGTSMKALEKAENALSQYKFMNWMNGFIQPRDGRTNIKSINYINEETTNQEEVHEDFESLDEEDDLLDDMDRKNPEQEEQRTPDSEKVSREGPPKPKKIKKKVQGAAKDALLEEMEFSLISKINSRMSERGKNEKEGNDKKEPDNEDIFCQALALDLKQLPIYERCIAKHELRNVLYKHQMSIMERQMRPCPLYNGQNNPNPNPG